jgi:hypothetical protein
MNSLLIYPPHHKYKIKNYSIKIDIQKREFVGTLINRNTKYWRKLYEIIDLIYMNKKKLPKGTLLYRCTIYKDPTNFILNNEKSKVIYFGLDFVIALWIGLEINEKSNKYIKCYLHIYELQKDIPYKYIYSLGCDGVPTELEPETCIKKACVHPQEILHGNEYPYEWNELGTEITFPINNFNKNNIKPLKTFEIDIQKLNENKNKYLYQWNPKKALKN